MDFKRIGTMNIKDLVKDTTVMFLYLRDEKLWYEVVGKEFEFPVELKETFGAIFLAEDKGMTFMRYIRKHLDFLEQSRKDNEAAAESGGAQ